MFPSHDVASTSTFLLGSVQLVPHILKVWTALEHVMNTFDKRGMVFLIT